MTSGEQERNLESVKDAIKVNANSAPADNGDASLKERLDSVELLVEELGQAVELQKELREYISDLKNEVADIRNYRFWITMFACVMSISLFALLVACMAMRPNWFLELDGSLQVPLIIALGGGSVFLMSLILRGVYRSRHERNHGEMLPEAVRVALDTFKGT